MEVQQQDEGLCSPVLVLKGPAVLLVLQVVDLKLDYLVLELKSEIVVRLLMVLLHRQASYEASCL